VLREPNQIKDGNAGQQDTGAAPAQSNKSAGAAPKPKKKASSESSSIRVGIDKVDSLLNLVGELVITQSMLRRFGEFYDPNVIDELRDGLIQLERHTRELQESAMQIRMLPINSSFNRFPRLVRDLSNTLGKKINLVVSGEQTEVDKTVLEKLSDPLVHLVRNSLDHGIEMPDVRVANGKDETGTLHLSAAHEGGNVVIKVEDDGAGLNRERIMTKAVEKGLVTTGENLSDERIDNLIFHPGFSTAEVVSDVSGRGVGMDVVRRNIIDLGGQIRVQSFPGRGTSLRISLPLTLAILDGQLVRVGEETYVISLLSIVETVQVKAEQIKTVSGSGEVYLLRERYIPVARAAGQFGVQQKPEDKPADLLVIVETENIRFGILVNELLEQQQIVIKSIEKNYKKVDGLTGATILGDGRVALILDIPGLLQNLRNNGAVTQEEQDFAVAA
jgi:two-component system chemotaxis sensor kinase CheA